MATEYGRALGAKLRSIRSSRACPCTVSRRSPRVAGRQWWSGRPSAVTGAVTVQKLAELADFYGVPVAELLPTAPGISLRAAGPAGARPGTLGPGACGQGGPVGPVCPAIQAQRGD